MRRRRRNQLVLGALFGIVVWWITNTVTHHARVAYETSGLEAAIDAADDGLIDPQLTISTNPTDLLVASVVLVVLLVFVVWRVFGGGERRPGEEHGSARWGEPGDIAPFMARQMDRNLLLTRTERLSLDRKKKVEHQRNLNVLVLGGSRLGQVEVLHRTEPGQRCDHVASLDKAGPGTVDVVRGHRLQGRAA